MAAPAQQQAHLYFMTTTLAEISVLYPLLKE